MNKIFFVLTAMFFSLLYLSLASFCYPNSNTINISDPFIIESDTCYSKCSMPSQYQLTEFYLPIFVGQDSTDVTFDVYERKTGVAKTKWIKKVDKNCQSEDPDDCVMWCFEAFDVETEKILFVADTLQTKEFVIKKFSDKVLKLQGGHQEWIAAVCRDKVTKLLIYKVCYKFSSTGYLPRGKCDGELNNDFITALNNYQEENMLPIGGFNLATLDHLGISY